MTPPQQPVEPWLVSPVTESEPGPTRERRVMSPRLPMLIGLLTFVVSLVMLAALAVVWGALFDSVARNVEMRQLVTRIEASEAQMGEVQEQRTQARASYQDGELSAEQLDVELSQIARQGAIDIAGAGERVAAVEWLAWHDDVQAAQLAYLAHNEAWIAYLSRAAADPDEFERVQDAVNETFDAAQQPMVDALPSWDLFDLRKRVDAIFAPSPSQSGGPTEQA